MRPVNVYYNILIEKSKELVSLFLVLSLILSFCVPAFADEAVKYAYGIGVENGIL